MLVVACACFGTAQAQMYYDVTVSGMNGGNYTVNYVPDCGPLPQGLQCAFVNLQEKVGVNGAWTHVSSGTASTAFTNRPAGTYFYRAHAAVYDTAYNLYEYYSPEASVVRCAAHRWFVDFMTIITLPVLFTKALIDGTIIATAAE
jgi:hypothetical protein